MRVRILAPLAALLILSACDAQDDGTAEPPAAGAQPGAVPPEPTPNIQPA